MAELASMSCRLCGDTLSADDDVSPCDVCGKLACDECCAAFIQQHVRRHWCPNERLVCVCPACWMAPDPSATDAWRELLAMYHALPGADKTIQCMDDVRALIKRREGPRDSAFTEWKRLHQYDDAPSPSAADDTAHADV